MKQDIEFTQQEQDYIERCSDQIKANTVFHRVHEEGIVLSEMSFEGGRNCPTPFMLS